MYRTTHSPITALEGLSLDIGKGEFVSVLGPSGCGKSTLLKLVAGLHPPTSGRITLDGIEVNGPRRDVGVVFQQPTLLPWRTVLNNVLVPARALRLDSAQARTKALELLSLVGLARFADNYPHELSGGMQQRVALVRGLVHEPSVLLMDEPFAALDALTREHMNLELQRIWMAKGKSALFITHSIPEAVFLSDRVIVLSSRPGRVIQEEQVNIPRPRSIETMANAAFGELCTRLRTLLGGTVSID